MKALAIFFSILAILTGSFGYWGVYTKEGRLKYDEMAGMIPEFALLISFLFFATAIILFAIVLIKFRRQSKRI